MSTGLIKPGERRFEGIAGLGDGVFPGEGDGLSGIGAALWRAPRWPVGLIGAVGLILAIEALVGRTVGTTPPRDRLASSYQSAIRAASGPEARADVLCFGDSLVKLGILPRVLEARLGASAYNLAVLGGQAPSSFFLFRRVLEQGHRPRAVIVNFSALLLAMDPRAIVECWTTLAEGRDRLELSWRTRDPTLAAAMTLQGLIASWHARDTVRAALGLGGHTAAEDGSRSEALRVFERNWRLNHGAQVAPRRFVPVAGAWPQPAAARGWTWRPLPVHAFYVAQFLSLAGAQQIPVYWVLTPATSAWRDRNEQAGTTRAYRQFVRCHLSRFPGLTVLDGQNVIGDHWAFRDPIHLNRDGALRLSLAVAESIARQQSRPAGAPRWIEFHPAEPPLPGDFQDLLEDLDQSRLAVHKGSGT